MSVGPNFVNELRAAGLAGLPFSWGDDGSFEFGLSMTDDQIASVQAVYAAHDPAKPDARAEIEALEKSVTPRRVREAVLGADNGWLASVNSQIAMLRGKL